MGMMPRRAQAGIVHVGCWAHVRRKFVQEVQARQKMLARRAKREVPMLLRATSENITGLNQSPKDRRTCQYKSPASSSALSVIIGHSSETLSTGDS